MTPYPDGPRDGLLGLTLARRLGRDPLGVVTEIGRTYGDIAYLRMGPIRAYFLNSPQLIRELLLTKNKSFRKVPWLTRPLTKIDGNGLVLSEGDFWLRQRRLVQPAFSTRRFDGYAQATVDFTRRMLDRWTAGSTFDMAAEMTHLTLEIIAKTLFDVELAGQVAQLGEAVHTISETFVREVSSPVRLPDWLPLPGKRRWRRAARMLDDLIWNIIRERRASGRDHGDLLSMLLLAVDEEGDGRGMTDVQARDEAITLFNAGHDSTAAALAWIWYLVARHPDVENKLIEEIDGAVGGRAPAYGDVAQLPYTEMVVKEAMRLYPPTWSLFPREALADVEMGGYTIARGSWVYAYPWVTQRDGRFFDDPEKFDPQRFAPGRIESIPPYAYFPFGAGPRVCIGNTFATMEMVLIIACVLQRFRVHLAADQGAVEPEALISIRPKGGLRVSLERRAAPALAEEIARSDA
jgi:cytochrome P450